MNSLQEHVSALNLCNQRGGRMLSLPDLIRAGTVNLKLGGYLAACVRQGASLLVGASPGGAGKTTVMCALLNFLPDQTGIETVHNRAVLQSARQNSDFGKTCYLAHEIGSGNYDAYVWSEAVRIFFHLAGNGHIIASNLHADTLEQTRMQLCDENGVAPIDLTAVQLKIFLDVRWTGNWEMARRVRFVYESNGAEDVLIWESPNANEFIRQEIQSQLVSSTEEEKYIRFLEKLLNEKIFRIEDVRERLLARGGRD